MIVGRFATCCRAACALILFAASTAAQALTSSAVFGYSGSAASDTRLELVTDTGVYTVFAQNLPDPSAIQTEQVNYETVKIYDRTGQHLHPSPF